ncbi:MAG: hypothetical protein OXH51_16845 [Gemmatimonadetes bacterium]|nr:hypothetical protein [Gemmatimonadota bacterium]MCY3678641.1 hypothetical protein [Gemmatimonadota bacterium]MYA41598.1 hypothetical protein [Gemmatimonadota bacterium]MYE95107.1 hypothetical protein [Gemmatimonadota bacterium]MYJ09790.1 hypothetical protein [Gemmatimonadota bacterium]
MNDHQNKARGSAPAGARPAAAADLDPETDPNRWEALVARILAEARPLLDARRLQPTLAGTLAGWRRPVIAAASGLAAAAVATLMLLPSAGGAEEVAMAEVMVPWSVAAWIEGSYAPTVEELVVAVEEYAP